MQISISALKAKPKTLKINQEDFDGLQKAVLAVVAKYPNAYKQYKDQGLSDMRYNWDVLRKSGYLTGENLDRLYKYLNDDHINSALAFILGNGGKSSKKGG